jgi:crossover junction endodeoxyribonuclease RuvC
MAFVGRYHPTVICLEGYSYGSTGGKQFDRVEFGGILRWSLCELACELYDVAPGTLKKFASGSGKGKKLGMVAVMSARWGVLFDTDDHYDAYGLARMAACIGGLMDPENAKQAEAVSTVMKTSERRSAPRGRRVHRRR